MGLALSGCFIVTFQSGSVERSARDDLTEPRRVHAPVKAFFVDGSTAVLPFGAEITDDSVFGSGTLYSSGLTDTTGIDAFALDSVVGIEAFQGQTDVVASVVATVGLSALATAGAVALFKAIFGSCPTLYATTENGGELQAEAFSYSIAPLLEGRDLDATAVAPDTDGVVRLELRNEALETHYINHLDLLAVDHEAGVRVVPSDREVPLGVREEVAPLDAVDGRGRPVAEFLREADGRAISTPVERIRSATAADPYDHVELTFPRPEAGDAVLVLRLRNSLLTTVLFYDMMLGKAGAHALDWIGRDMARIGTVVELGAWFQESMGLRVQVQEEGEWVTVGRIPDTGPIAWEDVGVVLPPGDSETVRVRLRFLADAWRIDRASLGAASRLRGEARVAVARVFEGGSPRGPEVLESVARPDDDYLTTYPGTSVLLEFDPPPVTPGYQRTYLLASQGYYTEWIRPEWIRRAGRPEVFRPDERTVESLMALWLDRKEALESDFFESRIPVR